MRTDFLLRHLNGPFFARFNLFPFLEALASKQHWFCKIFGRFGLQKAKCLEGVWEALASKSKVFIRFLGGLGLKKLSFYKVSEGG